MWTVLGPDWPSAAGAAGRSCPPCTLVGSKSRARGSQGRGSVGVLWAGHLPWASLLLTLQLSSSVGLEGPALGGGLLAVCRGWEEPD